MEYIFSDKDGNIHTINEETGDEEVIPRKEIEEVFFGSSIFKTLATDPDLLGEVLRHVFFRQEKGFGFVKTQELREGVQTFMDVHADGKIFQRAQSNVDGLGLVTMLTDYINEVIVFILPDDNIVLVNDSPASSRWMYSNIEGIARLYGYPIANLATV